MSHSEPTPIAIAVVEHEGRVLIGQRPPGVPLGGLWEFPGGKVNPQETPADAAARECLEETGLVVRVLGRLSAVEHAYDYDRLRLYFFSCVPEAPVPEPRPPFRWAAVGDLERYEFPSANQTLLRYLSQSRAVTAGAKKTL